MDKQEGKNPFKVTGRKITDLGVKATIVYKPDGKELCRDEVQLWRDNSRTSFITKCIEKLGQDLTANQEKVFREQLDEQLRKIEVAIKFKAANTKPVTDETGSSKPKEMSEEERKEALALLKDPELLGRVQDDLTKMGIVDEERNKVLTYLIATSRKMPQGLAGTFKAGSSAGKNHLVKGVASLFPEEEVKEFTHLSPKALYYMGEDGVKNKLVICTEVAGREGAEYAVRNLISEPCITSSIPVRSHDGGPPKTEGFKVNGPIAYLETTTSFKIHPENATRVFELYLNEAKDQTRDILRQQAREAGSESYQIKQKREEVRRVHRNAQKLLRSELDAVIPYSELIEYPPNDLRARRDFPKLLNLVKVIAFLHQYQRPTKQAPDGKEYIEATLVDYELAYNTAKDTFVETLDDLDKRSRDVLETTKQKVEELAKQRGKKVEQVVFDRDMVAEWCGKQKNKLQGVFEDLELGYFDMFDEDMNRIESGSKTTKKRYYRLNTARLNERPILADLTTPGELEKKWEGQAAIVGKVETEKPLENKDLLNLSHLSLLSHPLEEKK